MGSVNDTGGVDILASSPCTVLMIVSSEVFAIRTGADISNAGDFIQGPTNNTSGTDILAISRCR